MSACRVCGWRLAQWRGLCRTCGHSATGHKVHPTSMDLARCQHAAPVPLPDYTVIADGYEFEVVFDGRQSLLGDRRTLTDDMRDTAVRRERLRRNERAYRERQGVSIGYIPHRVDRRTA